MPSDLTTSVTENIPSASEGPPLNHAAWPPTDYDSPLVASPLAWWCHRGTACKVTKHMALFLIEPGLNMQTPTPVHLSQSWAIPVWTVTRPVLQQASHI